ncbi:hypothetical protein Pmani_031153 [Petrolisthes manimaculis]|uniref:Uncharacterized protein n=1 Tax=Petrolisthes manimaculis TaxID=1843537 RepID=A0AAE1NWH9_9EUCA|nr:hypothetical protein Pmani_031153 [Petrolisthes manimaculis]
METNQSASVMKSEDEESEERHQSDHIAQSEGQQSERHAQLVTLHTGTINQVQSAARVNQSEDQNTTTTTMKDESEAWSEDGIRSEFKSRQQNGSEWIQSDKNSTDDKSGGYQSEESEYQSVTLTWQHPTPHTNVLLDIKSDKSDTRSPSDDEDNQSDKKSEMFVNKSDVTLRNGNQSEIRAMDGTAVKSENISVTINNKVNNKSEVKSATMTNNTLNQSEMTTDVSDSRNEMDNESDFNNNNNSNNNNNNSNNNNNISPPNKRDYETETIDQSEGYHAIQSDKKSDNQSAATATSAVSVQVQRGSESDESESSESDGSVSEPTDPQSDIQSEVNQSEPGPGVHQSEMSSGDIQSDTRNNSMHEIKRDPTSQNQSESIIGNKSDQISEIKSDHASNNQSEFTSDHKSDTKTKIKSDNARENQSDITENFQSDIQREITGENQGEITRKIQSDIMGKIQSDIQREITGENQSDIQSDIQRKITGENQSDITGENQSDIQSDIQRKITGELQSDTTEENQSDIQSDLTVEMLLQHNHHHSHQSDNNQSDPKRDLSSYYQSEPQRDPNTDLERDSLGGVTSLCPPSCFCEEEGPLITTRLSTRVLPMLSQAEYATCVGDGQWAPPVLPLGVSRVQVRGFLMPELGVAGLEALGGRGLRELQVSQCRLAHLRHAAFTALPDLDRLDLSDNRLTQLGPDSLRGLAALRHLDLSSNHLANLTRPFTWLGSLQHLNLRDNRLSRLARDTFTGLARVQYVNLDGNRIVWVDVAAFQHLTSLAHLILSNNPLSTLATLDFFGSRLQYIDVSNIGIQRVPQALTQFVRDLRLGKNSIREIHRGDLDSYPYLGLLVLDDNGLELLEEDALGRHEDLARLWLNGNRLNNILSPCHRRYETCTWRKT